MKKLMPIYTTNVSNDKFIISNIFRKFIVINRMELEELYKLKSEQEHGNHIIFAEKKFEDKLNKNLFLIDDHNLQKYEDIYQTQNIGLFHSTSLHIFVLTLECNLKCRYCQAAYEEQRPTMMSETIAQKAINIALQSPEKHLTFEFQGGEPLLNFNTLKFIVEYTKKHMDEKKVDFSLVNNGQAMTDEKLRFLVDNDVSICFSIDGPGEVHDYNRPSKNGKSNFDNVLHWYNEAKRVYKTKGKKPRVTALPTITKYSLNYMKEIIDFYYKTLGEKEISIRPISPFGRAEKNWNKISYTTEDFLTFYKGCMDYMKKLPVKDNEPFTESFSNIIIDKMEGKIVNYPDLRSPCGAGTGQLAYNWNGKIYTCDEGRMMSNQGIEEFCVGSVDNTYNECITSSTVQNICASSCLEGHQICSKCVYHPICGICPVYNLKRQNDFMGNPPLESRCLILKGIMQYLIEWKCSQNEDDEKYYKKWAQR